MTADEHTLVGLLKDMKRDAHVLGGFPAPHSWQAYDERSKFGKPYRCMGYNKKVRQINALERLLKKQEVI